jgi:hypothetical protein
LGAVESGNQRLILEKPKGFQNLNYVDGDYSLEAKLKATDDAVDYPGGAKESRSVTEDGRQSTLPAKTTSTA